MTFTPAQWMGGAAAALLVGLSKTGVPGVGILTVPLLAMLFPGHLSIGMLLLLLLCGDCFAVAWYRQYARWEYLWKLMPWVLAGMAAGAGLLWYLAERPDSTAWLNPIIGTLVLGMLGLHLARSRWNLAIAPESASAVAATGGLAGFSTTLSNAAGPILNIYMTGLRLPKEALMGTSAWYYFLFNLAKVPIYVALTQLHPDKPFFTPATLGFHLALLPALLVGVYWGRWLLPRIPQQQFDALVLVLAAAAAIKLITG